MRSLEAATAQYGAVTDSLRGSFPEITTMLEAAEPDLTGIAALPREHWEKVWSNPIERLNREIYRRADVVQIFPDRDSSKSSTRNGATANADTPATPRCANS